MKIRSVLCGVVLAAFACLVGSTSAGAESVMAKSSGDHGAQKPSHGSKGGHGAAWGYKGNNGPSHWGDLADKYILCKRGTTQSPINLSPKVMGKPASLQLDYKVTPLSVLNNGHTVQVNYAPGSMMKVEGKVYDLLQFHFHSPSEHTVGNKAYPLEAHFVHKDKNGHLAVLGVFFKEGKPNLALQEIWDRLPTLHGETKNYKKVVINGRDLMPFPKALYRYMGSLTTPPCSEGVNWFVLKSSVTLSKAQIKKFTSVIHDNARPVQEVGNRLIVGME